ncbi:tetratricopeptide repeat protein [Candidatus Omnitrophota bacterium]
MRRGIVLFCLLAAVSFVMPLSISAQEYDFGDFKSSTLTAKAWIALAEGNIEAVLAYTNKCVALYAEEAKNMQAGLTDYASGSNQDIFKYWALNDVGTCVFIQGEAYKNAQMLEEAKESYASVINDYSYAQCWDTKGWFWKPAEAAKEKLSAIETGQEYDFGDNASQTLTTKAWAALTANDLDAVLAFTDKCINSYQDKAQEMQASLNSYPWEKKEVFSYWALNDVGTCLFIKGEALRKAGRVEEAKDAFDTLRKSYFFAQCWDTQGWFWKPVDAAREKLAEMEK